MLKFYLVFSDLPLHIVHICQVYNIMSVGVGTPGRLTYNAQVRLQINFGIFCFILFAFLFYYFL